MSIRYSQDFKDSLVKLHQEGRSLKSAQKNLVRRKILLLFGLNKLTQS
ncbi:hypothetical protein ACI78X_04750 [Leuconostoc mesenteroides]|nr:hypothetical protein [Leuconostoc mesenteroides]